MLHDTDFKDFSGHDAKHISWQSIFNTPKGNKPTLTTTQTMHHLLQLTLSCNYEASGIPEMSSVRMTWQGPGNALPLALKGSYQCKS